MSNATDPALCHLPRVVSPTILARVVAWLDAHPRGSLSDYRRKDAVRLLADGWADVREVSSVTRGAPGTASVAIGARDRYAVEIRPASGGRWGKSVVYRVAEVAS